MRVWWPFSRSRQGVAAEASRVCSSGVSVEDGIAMVDIVVGPLRNPGPICSRIEVNASAVRPPRDRSDVLALVPVGRGNGTALTSSVALDVAVCPCVPPGCGELFAERAPMRSTNESRGATVEGDLRAGEARLARTRSHADIDDREAAFVRSGQCELPIIARRVPAVARPHG